MTGEVEAAIRDRLEAVMDPCSVAAGNPMNMVEMGLLKQLRLDDGVLDVVMCLTSPQCLMLEHFVAEIGRIVADFPEIHDIKVRGDGGMDWTPSRMRGDAIARRHDHLRRLRTER